MIGQNNTERRKAKHPSAGLPSDFTLDINQKSVLWDGQTSNVPLWFAVAETHWYGADNQPWYVVVYEWTEEALWFLTALRHRLAFSVAASGFSIFARLFLFLFHTSHISFTHSVDVIGLSSSRLADHCCWVTYSGSEYIYIVKGFSVLFPLFLSLAKRVKLASVLL